MPYELSSSASGAPVLTDRVYRNWAREYELEATDPKFAGKLVQCSDNCPKLEGIPFAPFSAIPSHNPNEILPTIDFRPQSKTAASILPYGQWITQLQGYSDRLTVLMGILTKDPTTEELQTIHVYLSTILIPEIFFSNWIAQCSTRESTDAWNLINLLDMNVELDHTDTRKTRLARYTQLLEVFVKTAGLLCRAIKEGEDSHYEMASK